MISVYKVGRDTAWKTELFGTWNVERKLQKSDKMIETTSIRRLNLNQFEIKICYVLTNSDSINHLTDGM